MAVLGPMVWRCFVRRPFAVRRFFVCMGAMPVVVPVTVRRHHATGQDQAG